LEVLKRVRLKAEGYVARLGTRHRSEDDIAS
jgi:hypothetical protein